MTYCDGFKFQSDNVNWLKWFDYRLPLIAKTEKDMYATQQRRYKTRASRDGWKHVDSWGPNAGRHLHTSLHGVRDRGRTARQWGAETLPRERRLCWGCRVNGDQPDARRGFESDWDRFKTEWECRRGIQRANAVHWSESSRGAPFGRPGNYLANVPSIGKDLAAQRNLIKIVKQASAVLSGKALESMEDTYIATLTTASARAYLPGLGEWVGSLNNSRRISSMNRKKRAIFSDSSSLKRFSKRDAVLGMVYV